MKSTFNFKISIIGLGAIFIFAPALSHASSCCSGGGGQTICVLPSEQNYQVGMSTSYRSIKGHFDPYGEYSANSDGNAENIKTVVLGGAYRINEDWQAGASVPIANNEHITGSARRSSTGLGDPVVEGRYTFWEDLRFLPYRPALVFAGGLRAPLGNSVYNSTDPYGTNVFGDGTFTAHAAASASKMIRSFRFSADGTFFYPFSKTVSQIRGAPVADPYTLKEGNRIQTQESAAYLFSEHWSTSLGIKQLWQFETSTNGSAVDGSAARLFSSSIAVNYFHDRSWSFGTSFETAAPFYSYLANQPNFVSLAVTGAYGGF